MFCLKQLMTRSSVWDSIPNSSGCLGLGHNSVVEEPKLIPELCDKNVKKFFIGYDFVLALNSANQLFGWGQDVYGILPVDQKSSFTPQLIEHNIEETIVDISCGLRQTLALTSNGLVY